MKRPNIYAKHALLEMHAPLAGEVQKSNEHKLVMQIREIESVIKMIVPSFKINRIAVRRMQPSGWFKRGTVTRTCLDVLRQAGRPLTVREIMAAALISKGQDPDAEKIAKFERSLTMPSEIRSARLFGSSVMVLGCVGS
jgi:hypothetical protein